MREATAGSLPAATNARGWADGARAGTPATTFSRDGRAWGPGRGGPYHPLKFFSGRGLVATVDPFPRLVLNDGKKVICD